MSEGFKTADIAGQADSILVSQVVRDLCRGKRPGFAEHGEVYLPGFDEPVTLFEVDPKASDSEQAVDAHRTQRRYGRIVSEERSTLLELGVPFRKSVETEEIVWAQRPG
jgi:hypothetical protein